MASAAQQVFIGGAHELNGGVQIFDLETKAPIAPAQYVWGDWLLAAAGLSAPPRMPGEPIR